MKTFWKLTVVMVVQHYKCNALNCGLTMVEKVNFMMCVHNHN